MEYLRIRYLRANGFQAAVFDSYVLKVVRDGWSDSDATHALMKQGFRRVSEAGDGTRRDYDEEELICPGAIMSITPCDERGYSQHDLEQQKKKR
jgi:hypothetical protein